MNELERRIEILEKQLKEKQTEINVADELHYDEVDKLEVDIRMMIDLNNSYQWNNGVLICVIIVQAILIVTGWNPLLWYLSST